MTPYDEWTFLRGGYYSRTLHDANLTVLSLNTVLYSGYFNPTPKNVYDPGWQLAWMRQILSGCRENGTQAMILGHIPPGIGSYRHTQMWKDIYVQSYYDIVKEFDDVIIAQLFGHLHTDEFRVGPAEQSDSKEIISMIPKLNTPLLLGPSITPLHGNDPSFRIFTYGRRGGSESHNEEYKLLDYESHRCKIASGNHWSKLYTFSEAYDVASDVIAKEGLSSESYRTILESMDDKMGRESKLMKSYRSFMISGADGDETARGRGANVGCDSRCRDEMMCTLQSATSSGYENCLLQRKHYWTGNGASISGLVEAAVFVTVVLIVVIVRFRKRGKRDEYESTSSVTGAGHSVEVHANDQEMI